MTYQRFEDVPVWQAGLELAEKIFTLTTDLLFVGQGDLANQLQRTALSIPNNIAEGFECGSTSQLIAFLYYARGSAGEVRSIFCLLERMPRFANLKSQISDLKSAAESCSRQLRAWADHLQNTQIKGPRHLNDVSRARYDQSRRSDAFRQKLQDLRAGVARPSNQMSMPDRKESEDS